MTLASRRKKLFGLLGDLPARKPSRHRAAASRGADVALYRLERLLLDTGGPEPIPRSRRSRSPESRPTLPCSSATLTAGSIVWGNASSSRERLPGEPALRRCARGASIAASRSIILIPESATASRERALQGAPLARSGAMGLDGLRLARCARLPRSPPRHRHRAHRCARHLDGVRR